MARISYDDQTAAAYKAARDIPRNGLSDCGKEQLRRAVEQAGPAARNEARTSWLELLVLR